MKIAIVTIGLFAITLFSCGVVHAGEEIRLNGKRIHVGDSSAVVARTLGLPVWRGKGDPMEARSSSEIWRYRQSDRQIELQMVDGRVAAIAQQF